MHLIVSPVDRLSPSKGKQPGRVLKVQSDREKENSAANATWVCPPLVTSSDQPEKSQIIENWRDITPSRKKATSNTDDYKHICCVLHLNDVTMKCIRR